jgi:hypothetical protein
MTFRHKLLRPIRICCFAWLLLLGIGSGCHGGRATHSRDPHLRKVDEMLSAKIREGMPRAQVLTFLKSRGYQFEARPDMASLRVLVRHVDAETLQPMVVRATFHFDSYDRLVTYELQPAPDVPFQP